MDKAKMLFDAGLVPSMSMAKRMIVQLNKRELDKIINELADEQADKLHDMAIEDNMLNKKGKE